MAGPGSKERPPTARRASRAANRGGDAKSAGVPAGVRTGSSGQAAALAYLLLLALVICVFRSVTRNGFINLDDPWYVYENIHVQRGLTWESIRWAFTTLEGGFWHPLTWLSLMADSQLHGLTPGGYHLTSLLLHATSTLVLFAALRLLTGATWRSAVVAALFAVHPLHVEPVAWVADRKDVLSGLFWMFSLYLYASYAKKAESRSPNTGVFYALTILSFIAALMSKATVMAFPFILLLLDVWPLGRIGFGARAVGKPNPRRVLWEKAPFLVAGALVGLVSLHGQGTIGAVHDVTRLPIGDRLANAVLSVAHYVRQTFWPVDLAVYYPYPAVFRAWPVVAATLACLIVTALALWASRRRPYLGLGWLWMLVALLPAIGLVQVGGASHGDRFMYLPSIGLLLLITWGVHDLLRTRRHSAALLGALALGGLAFCATLTSRQLGYWRNSESLYRRAIAVTGDSPLIQMNLGTALAAQGRQAEAIDHLREAVRLVPDYTDALSDLGAALGSSGQFDEAINVLSKAVRLAPDFAVARCNLGDALSLKGRFEEAITQYQEALRLKPDIPGAHYHLGIALGALGHLDEAIDHFQEALRLNPGYVEASRGLRTALDAKAAAGNRQTDQSKP
jgi:tetratricopeptide (TPR) repeat protein